MALIDKIKAIADAIREKTGSTGLLTLDEMAEMIEFMDTSGSGEIPTTYILVDEDGYEIPAVLTEEEVELTADPVTDIRVGMTAVTEEGVVTGQKEIPAYIATEGSKLITAGSKFLLPIPNGNYSYTKLQAIFCPYANSLTSSVAAKKVAIDGKVYPVDSTIPDATITLNSDDELVDFGITNDSGSPYLIRYFSYREVY